MLIKEQVNETLLSMPDEFEMDDIVDKLILLNKIEEGLSDSKTGRVLTEDEAAKRLDKWLR
jgi:predicted transcriptional regulator